MAAAQKHDPEFMTLLTKCAHLDEATGALNFKEIYASVVINFGWKGSVVSIPYSHVVWFLKHGRWPKTGLYLDHINDNAMDNRPDNFQELTHKENQAKRRGRIVYRSYGTGKYGYGLHIIADKRDGRFYITRQLSRGHGAGDGKNIKKGLGGFDTLEAAEAKVVEYAKEVEANGLDHMPAYGGRDQRQISRRLQAETMRIRSLRSQGHTLEAIVNMTGFSFNTVRKKVMDIKVDKFMKREARKGCQTSTP
jgi:hypothetical protein